MINQCGAHLSVTLTRYALRARISLTHRLCLRTLARQSRSSLRSRELRVLARRHPEETCAQSNVIMDTANWTAGRDGVMPRHVLASKQAQVRMLSP